MGALNCVPGEMKSTESTEVFTIMAVSNSCLDVPRRDCEGQFGKQTNDSKHSVWWTLAVDLPLVLMVLALVGLFELGVLPHHARGYYCNDPALSMPFTGDTVSFGVIVASIILLPVPVLIITELVFIDTTYIELQRSRMRHYAANVLWLYRSYMYGLFFNLVLVEFMKGVVGEPRPTFFAICEPLVNGRKCNGTGYVTEFECSKNQFSRWFQVDSYHSFPSGHTSLSVHCGLFCAWYLQKRAFNWQGVTIFVVPFAQMALLSYSAFCSLTRITDHRHHWWDVTVGFGVGLASLMYSVIVLCDNFSFFKNKEEQRHSIV